MVYLYLYLNIHALKQLSFLAQHSSILSNFLCVWSVMLHYKSIGGKEKVIEIKPQLSRTSSIFVK